jgi:hypothetical protein
MKTAEDIKKHIQFASSTKDGSRSYTPLLKSSKQQRTSDLGATILKNWTRNSIENLENSSGNNDDKLRAILDGFGLNSQKIEAFMEKHGKNLLIFSILFRNSSEHLRFICDYVPKELLKRVLVQDNYYVLGALLLGNSEIERQGMFNIKVQEEQASKIKLLLEIDPKGLESCLESDDFKKKYAPEVQACFKQIVVEYKKALLDKHSKKNGGPDGWE